MIITTTDTNNAAFCMLQLIQKFQTKKFNRELISMSSSFSTLT